MNKLAILVGNNEGLPGVKKDLIKFKNYLKSLKGGVWIENELRIFEDTSRTDLLDFLNQVKYANLDYILFYFSGHGHQKRGVQISLNNSDEIIEEDEIFNLSKKQLTIFDCCRGVEEYDGLGDVFESNKHILGPVEYSIMEKYEKAISIVPDQQMILYSCSKGEYSSDTQEGGLYTKNLLKSAIESNDEYVFTIDSHCNAYCLTIEANKNQHPDYLMAKLPKQKQLIFVLKLN